MLMPGYFWMVIDRPDALMRTRGALLGTRTVQALPGHRGRHASATLDPTHPAAHGQVAPGGIRVTPPLLLTTLEGAAETLAISARGVRRLIDAGELAPVRIGRSLRVSAESLRRYVDRAIPESHTHPSAGPDVQERSTCRESANKTKTASIVVPIRPSGGRPTPTRTAKELDALLGQRSGRKPTRS